MFLSRFVFGNLLSDPIYNFLFFVLVPNSRRLTPFLLYAAKMIRLLMLLSLLLDTLLGKLFLVSYVISVVYSKKSARVARLWAA